jgi:hypothetical protein
MRDTSADASPLARSGMPEREPDQALKRVALLRRGVRLEVATVSYNALEGLVAIAAGLVAGSVVSGQPLPAYGHLAVVGVDPLDLALHHLDAFSFEPCQRP